MTAEVQKKESFGPGKRFLDAGKSLWEEFGINWIKIRQKSIWKRLAPTAESGIASGSQPLRRRKGSDLGVRGFSGRGQPLFSAEESLWWTGKGFRSRVEIRTGAKKPFPRTWRPFRLFEN
jgi:hypothetical protein